MRSFTVAGALALIGGFGLMAIAEDKPKEITVKGEIVDLACWLEDGKIGAEHKKCATSCLKGGTPAGVLLEDGTVYLLVPHGSEGKVSPELAGEMVEVKGKLLERGGLKGITAKTIKKVEKGHEGSEGSGK
ncbi:MAG: hypothetical protein HUU15_00970 [Candidatus Brocadiae bacterium]|nr:hypothetical protein [Candidatus Brocadiia bacterium]